MGHPLAAPGFRYLLLSRALAALAAFIPDVALLWWTLEKSGQPANVAFLALAGALGGMLASPIGGVWADRGSKRLLLFRGYLLAAGVAVAAAVAVNLPFSLPLLLGILFLDGVVNGLRAPAFTALLPRLVPPEQLPRANGLLEGVAKGASALSFPLGGLLVALLGPAAAMGVAAVARGLAGLLALALPEDRAPVQRETPKAETSGSRGSFSEGVRAVLSSPLLVSLVITASLLNLAAAPLTVVLAPLAKAKEFGVQGYGFLGGGIVGGELLGFLLMGLVARSLWGGPRGLFALTLLVALSLLGLAAAPTLPWGVASLALGGFAAALMNVYLATLLQTGVEPSLLGRAAGLLQALSMALQPLGYLAGGVLLLYLTPGQVLYAMGGILALSGLLWLRPAVVRGLASHPGRLEEERAP